MNTAAAPVMNFRYLIIGIAMLVAAGLAVAITPREKIADQGPKVDLETMIPKQFGDWKVDETLAPQVVSPDVQAKLNAIYGQTLSRTYTNPNGERVMLSIAYGSNQGTDEFQVHRPEYCYKAQGFELEKSVEDSINLTWGSLAVRRLIAAQRTRLEPITYWITIGDKTTLPGIGRKLAQLSYGLTGKVPDGLLFRISSIDNDVPKAYQLQNRFVQALLQTVNPADRTRLVGKFQ
jgi:EpsI family protein